MVVGLAANPLPKSRNKKSSPKNCTGKTNSAAAIEIDYRRQTGESEHRISASVATPNTLWQKQGPA